MIYSCTFPGVLPLFWLLAIPSLSDIVTRDTNTRVDTTFRSKKHVLINVILTRARLNVLRYDEIFQSPDGIDK